MTKQSAEEAVQRFFSEMHKWESECANRDAKCANGFLDYEETERMAMEEYHRIFAEHCSTTATPRDFHYSEPPEYDPERLKIERTQDAEDGSVLVFIYGPSDPTERLVFRLLREGSRWRIKDKSFISGTGELIEANL